MTALGPRFERLRLAALPIAQATLASGLAWVVSKHLLGHAQPIFAPISAIIVLGLTLGQRRERAVEVVAGAVLGVVVADLLVQVTGSGTWQIVVVVPVAMSLAVLLSPSPMVVIQTGVAAVLVIVLPNPESFSLARSIDVLVGSGAALVAGFLALPPDPVRLLQRDGVPLLDELAGTLDDVADALADEDRDAAERALLRARRLDRLAAAFAEALATGRETAVAALPRRRSMGALEAYAQIAAQLDLAVRNTRVIARGARRGLEVGDRMPPQVATAVRELAASVRALAPWLEDPSDCGPARDAAVRAAAEAGEVLETTANLSVSLVVGSVRAAAVDILRGTGLERDEALARVRGGQLTER